MSRLSELAARLERHSCIAPIGDDITIAACIKADKCGCEERETLEAATALRECEQVLFDCRAYLTLGYNSRAELAKRAEAMLASAPSAAFADLTLHHNFGRRHNDTIAALGAKCDASENAHDLGEALELLRECMKAIEHQRAHSTSTEDDAYLTQRVDAFLTKQEGH